MQLYIHARIIVNSIASYMRLCQVYYWEKYQVWPLPQIWKGMLLFRNNDITINMVIYIWLHVFKVDIVDFRIAYTNWTSPWGSWIGNSIADYDCKRYIF